MTTKTFKIKLEDDGVNTTIYRENDGFNYLELIGVLNITTKNIIDNSDNNITPDKTETKVFVNGQIIIDWFLNLSNEDKTLIYDATFGDYIKKPILNFNSIQKMYYFMQTNNQPN